MSISQSGYDETASKSLGLYVDGEATSDEGNLGGDFTIYHESSGGVVDTQSVSGSFNTFLGPGAGVTDGATADPVITTASLAARFEPTFSGLAYTNSDVTAYHDIAYSGVEGHVTDVSGDPVEGATLEGDGETTVTDSNGYYDFLAPEGVTNDLLGLKDSKVKSFTAPSGSKETVDWQFAGIKIEVRNPDGDPVENVSVEFGGKQIYTDAQGVALFEQAALDTNYEVRLFESDSLKETIKSPATEGEITLAKAGQDGDEIGGGGDGTGPFFIELSIVDLSNGDPVSGVLTTELGSGETTRTGRSGKGAMYLPTDADEEANLLSGTETKRYRAAETSLALEYGTTNEITIRLEPRREPTQK